MKLSFDILIIIGTVSYVEILTCEINIPPAFNENTGGMVI